MKSFKYLLLVAVFFAIGNRLSAWYNKYVSVFSSGLVSQPSFVNFESSCCLMLAIDQLRRRRVTSKNNACLSKLLRGLGKQVHTSFFLF